MESNYVMQTALTIREQLLSLTPLNVILSWGTKNFAATEYKDMAALRFEVNGRLFKGYVIIAYNAMDYYEIFLQKGPLTKCIRDEVYFDELGQVIDEAIESGNDKAEYEMFCMKEYEKLKLGLD